MKGFLERSGEVWRTDFRIPDVEAEWMVGRAKGSLAGVVVSRCCPPSLQAGVYSLTHSPETEITLFLHNTWLFSCILMHVKVREAWSKIWYHTHTHTPSPHTHHMHTSCKKQNRGTNVSAMEPSKTASVFQCLIFHSVSTLVLFSRSLWHFYSCHSKK